MNGGRSHHFGTMLTKCSSTVSFGLSYSLTVLPLYLSGYKWWHRRCFLRCLRLCCVSTPELAPAPWSSSPMATAKRKNKPRDQTSNATVNASRWWIIDEFNLFLWTFQFIYSIHLFVENCNKAFLIHVVCMSAYVIIMRCAQNSY